MSVSTNGLFILNDVVNKANVYYSYMRNWTFYEDNSRTTRYEYLNSKTLGYYNDLKPFTPIGGGQTITYGAATDWSYINDTDNNKVTWGRYVFEIKPEKKDEYNNAKTIKQVKFDDLRYPIRGHIESDGKIDYIYYNYLQSIGTVYNISHYFANDVKNAEQAILSNTEYSCNRRITPLLYPLSYISANAFDAQGDSRCGNINKICIPRKISSIKQYAFRDCSNLMQVYSYDENGTEYSNLNNISNIGDGIFENSKIVNMPFDFDNSTGTRSNLTRISDYAFYNCKYLTNILVLGGDLKNNEKYNDTSVVGLTDIGRRAFEKWATIPNIQYSLKIKNSVENIDRYAFYNCEYLNSIEIGKNVENIDSYAFSRNVEIDPHSGIMPRTRYVNTLTFSKLSSSTNTSPELKILDGAFNYVLGEVTISLPNRTKEIGSNAFSNASTLNVYFGSQANNILNQDWADVKLTNSDKLNKLTAIRSNAFSNNPNISKIYIPYSVDIVNTNAFSNCCKNKISSNPKVYWQARNAQTSYNTDTSISSIFYNSAINSISFIDGCSNVPNYICAINWDDGESALRTNLDTVNIAGSVCYIGNSAFKGTDISQLNIENGVYSIGDEAFGESYDNATYLSNKRLSLVNIPDSVTYLGTAAFSGWEGVGTSNNRKSVLQFGCGLEYISSNAFHCTKNGLNDFIALHHFISYPFLPPTLEYVGWPDLEPFHDIDSLTPLFVPRKSYNWYYFNTAWSSRAFTFRNVTAIEDMAYNPITNPSLPLYYADENYEYYLIPIAYNNDMWATDWVADIHQYKKTATPASLPTSIEIDTHFGKKIIQVKGIGECAFENKMQITSITIPWTYTHIGPSAFRGCTNLTSVTFETQSELGDLDRGTAIINTCITSIGRQAFDSCIRLTELHIPDSVTSVGKFAFAYCIALQTISFGKRIQKIEQSAFYGAPNVKNITFDSENHYFSSICETIGNTSYGVSIICNKNKNTIYNYVRLNLKEISNDYNFKKLSSTTRNAINSIKTINKYSYAYYLDKVNPITIVIGENTIINADNEMIYYGIKASLDSNPDINEWTLIYLAQDIRYTLGTFKEFYDRNLFNQADVTQYKYRFIHNMNNDETLIYEGYNVLNKCTRVYIGPNVRYIKSGICNGMSLTHGIYLDQENPPTNFAINDLKSGLKNDTTIIYLPSPAAKIKYINNDNWSRSNDDTYQIIS